MYRNVSECIGQKMELYMYILGTDELGLVASDELRLAGV